MHTLLFLTVVLLLAAAPVFPQANTANVVGAVTDPSGGVVPAAVVTIQNRQTGQIRTAQTDAQGNYEFPFLQIGEYSIAVEKAGFQKSEVAPFSLSLGQSARIDITMTLGQTAELSRCRRPQSYCRRKTRQWEP
jgi:Carboxypeptidase regulatory-like domain